LKNLSIREDKIKCNININIRGLDSHTGLKIIIKLSTVIFPRTLFS